MSIRNFDVRHIEETHLLTPALAAVRREHGRVRSRPLIRTRLGTRNPDVLLTSGDGLVSIELKMNDWARAVGQAALNRLWVEHSYIAIPTSSVTETVVSHAREHGIGVIIVSGRKAQVVCRAAPSNLVDAARLEVTARVVTAQ